MKEEQLELTGVASSESPTYTASSLSDFSDDEVIQHAKRILNRRCANRRTLTCADDMRDWLQLNFAETDREHFIVILLDTQHRIIKKETLFVGTIDSSAVYPREIIKTALVNEASAVILAHNHPSGITEPSMSDMNITQKIQKALNVIDVRLLDHFVVGLSGSVSFAERGLI